MTLQSQFPDRMALVDAIAAAVIVKLKPVLEPGQQVKPRLLTVQQAAVYIGRTPNALRILMGRKTLPAVKSDGRVMLDIHDLDRWIEENKTGAE